MKKVLYMVLFALMLLGTVATGYAQPGYEHPGPPHGDWRGSIRERIHETERRIERGVERGTLTHHEARRLRGELERIRYRIARMRSDGYLDPVERDRIQRSLDRLNRDISIEKHDYDRRGDYGHRRY